MTRRKLVVHVSSVHKAGDPRIFEKECTTLHRAGYEVAIVATGASPDQPPFRVIALPRASSRPIRMLTGAVQAVAAAVRMRPALVHLHDPELIPWIPVLRILRIKVIFDAHEDIAATMLHKPYLGRTSRRLAATLGRLLVRLADRTASGVVSATPSIAQAFRNPRSAVVQNFPILDTWTASSDDGAPTNRLVYIGGLSEERGAWQMLDALDALHTSHRATLVLAGPIPDALLVRLERHPAWRHVDYRGTLPRGDVATLLSGCSIGVVLFQPLPNHVNSQPTKMFEYMAAGLAVLASDYPLWRRLISDTGAGMVASPTDPEKIAEVARSMIDEPERCRAMGRRGRVVVQEEHNWQNEATTLLDLYSSIMA